MLGSLAAGATYTGFEPDPNTFRGLQGILEDVGKTADIHNQPAETGLTTLESGVYDLVLTSPPYYNLEMYTAGDQSVKDQTWEEWVDGWLKPVIHECIRCLKSNGKSCWSVKNFKSDKKYPLADITKKIHKDAGWELVKTVPMNGSGRPGGKRIQQGKEKRMSNEETLCFKKENNRSV